MWFVDSQTQLLKAEYRQVALKLGHKLNDQHFNAIKI